MVDDELLVVRRVKVFSGGFLLANIRFLGTTKTIVPFYTRVHFSTVFTLTPVVGLTCIPISE